MSEFDIELPPNTLDDLKLGKKKLQSVKKFITQAKIANIDTTQMEKDVNEQDKKLDDIQRGFFPNDLIN